MQRLRTRIAIVLALLPGVACVFGGGSTPNPRTSEPSDPAPHAAPEDRAPIAAEPAFALEADAPAPQAATEAPAPQPALVLSADAPTGSLARADSDAADKEFEGEGLAFERAAGMLSVWVPKDEHLTFDVVVDLPVVGNVTAGQVVLSAKVEPYVTGLLASKQPEAPREWMGSVGSVATGSALGYTLHEELKSRLLPQVFPRMYYTDTQTGSENRRKELKLGVKDGKYVDNYKNDGHCKGCNNREHFVDSNWIWGKPSHCDGCKRAEHRVWRDPKEREVPDGTLDMLSAVYLARTMVREGKLEETLHMVDELKLWNVQLKQGAKKRLEVPAGRFDCVEVRLKSSLPPGEPPPKGGFEGLFGLKGTIQVWLDARTGVPVQIQGEFPIKLISSNLDVFVQLKGYRGTPKGFGPVP
jgi:hypothetical protein